MYSYINGTITAISGDHIVIENSSIGYLIKTPNPFNYELGKKTTIHTYLNVREDAIELFGFTSSEERDFFLKLISVKGLGPKGALAIIGSESIDKVINAINNGDSKYLQKFPGIGPKASQQIILDLHGKINFNSQNTQANPKIKQTCDALQSMGYSANEIKKVTPIIENNLDKNISDIIKIALKNLF